MQLEGFSVSDYHLMQNCCNSFTEELARRLDLLDRYPSAVLNQSKLGEMLSPVARILDLVPENNRGEPKGSCASGFKRSLSVSGKMPASSWW